MTSGEHTRILLYSHDSWGLGHLRRSLAIAGAIQRKNNLAATLIVTGSPCATQFELPEGCDVLKLPAVSKDADGNYVPRKLGGQVSNAIQLRSRLISEAYRSFRPHIVIVDHQLTGLLNEALDMLQMARQDGCLLIYGMRDVLDEPKVVEAAWNQPEHQWALREAYDRIFIYGDPMVFDPSEAYALLHPYRSKIEFTGYIVAPIDLDARMPVPSLRRRVMVTTGGGEDGGRHINKYLDALELAAVSWDSHIVTGPLVSDPWVRDIKRRVYGLGLAEQVRISQFVPNMQRKLQQSDAVVSMAGYNTCSEIMQSGLPSILLPRQAPRREQLIRAKRLEQLGLADCQVDPSAEVLRERILAALEQGRKPSMYPSLDGVDKICEMLKRARAETDNAMRGERPPLRRVVR